MKLLCRFIGHDWRHVEQTYSRLMEGDDRYLPGGALLYWEDVWACQRCHVHETRYRGIPPRAKYQP